MYNNHPEKFAQIEDLERQSLAAHPIPPHELAIGKVRAQWGERPASWWRARFDRENAQGKLPFGPDPIQFDEMPCDCFDGAEDVGL